MVRGLGLLKPKNTNGFTIVEVMIALAISTFMLVAGIATFSQTRQNTGFDQAVYDLQSQINSYATQASTKNVSSFNGYTCSLVPASLPAGRPVLAAGSGTNNSCVYLGQTLQFIKSGNDVFSYPVFGANIPSVDPSGGYNQFNPEPAYSGTTPLLSDNYELQDNLNFLWAYTKSSFGTENDLLTLYNSLDSSNTSGNELTARSYKRSYTAQNFASGVNPVKSCIETPESCGGSPGFTDMGGSAWVVCVGDGTTVANSKKQATVAVSATATGITTKVDIGPCPTS